MSMPGMWEIALIIVILVVLFGGKNAMSTIKDLGKSAYKAKKEVDDIKNLNIK